MVSSTAITTALDLTSKLPDLLRSARSGSLIEYTKPTRVEPLVMLDERCANLSYTPDILQSVASIFSGYYLQAVALSVNVGRVDVIKLLDRLNPERSALDNAARRAGTAFESFEYALPVPGQATGLEAYGNTTLVGRDVDDVVDDYVDDAIGSSGGGVTDVKKSGETIRENSNLSVGKLLEVEVESDGQKAVFMVAVRLMVNNVGSNTAVHTLSLGQRNTSAKERYHAWRAGQLTFIRDLVLCQDIIDAHKDGLINDTSGIYKTSMDRRRQNKLSAIFSGQPSVATASNIAIIADATRKDLEREIGGRLKDFRTREKLFKATYTMLLVVVDPDWESVTIYHRSIDQPTQLSASEVKNASKGKGPDIADILKMYTQGQSPRL